MRETKKHLKSKTFEVTLWSCTLRASCVPKSILKLFRAVLLVGTAFALKETNICKIIADMFYIRGITLFSNCYFEELISQLTIMPACFPINRANL